MINPDQSRFSPSLPRHLQDDRKEPTLDQPNRAKHRCRAGKWHLPESRQPSWIGVPRMALTDFKSISNSACVIANRNATSLKRKDRCFLSERNDHGNPAIACLEGQNRKKHHQANDHGTAIGHPKCNLPMSERRWQPGKSTLPASR